MARRTVGWKRPFMALVAVGVTAVAGHGDSREAVGAVGVPGIAGGATTRTQVATTNASCRARDDCGSPLKGGLRITFTGWACTIGFIAQDPDDHRFYAITAGHCISGSGVYAQWSHHRAPIGHAALDAFSGEPTVDAGAIEIDGAAVSDELYATGQNDVRRVTAFVPDEAQALGTEVCRAGGASGWTCGHIVRRDVPTTIEGKHVDHTWWTDFPSASGDSGSPVIDREGRLLGIAVATTATQTVYVPVDDVMKALHVLPCVQADRC